LYRSVARLVLDRGGSPGDSIAAEAAANKLTLQDLRREDLRDPTVDAAVPLVSSFPGVRAALLRFQREFAIENGGVLDGRDIGTVVFPDAQLKLFVTASLSERARRRWMELRSKGISIELTEVQSDLLARDTQDEVRATSPLRPATDAVVLDSTDMDAATVSAWALDIISDRFPGLSREIVSSGGKTTGRP